MISIHHNSVGDTQDNFRVRGLEARYTNDSGRLLAKSLAGTVASRLHRVERATRYQALGVLRNHKFPSALLEMSFITNPDEYEFAAGENGARLSADAIAAGILTWIDNQQKWVK
jgi:N-acetylmuramoyl-L-alanine amidase